MDHAANISNDVRTEEQFLRRIIQNARKDLKATMLDKLKDHDWLTRMRLKCRSYIQNNGTKVISIAEVKNFLKDEAIKSFPQNLYDEMEKELIESYEPIFEFK